ncbi:family 1 glycosylhydrolase [Pediococcus acidilactici]|uniref:glycoside hydrolase family 1 protein n=1 Tax=Pediococcus acidilactici TaxID=1254 RepID=UPI001320E1E2|nr:glycoside hydrolase family 1 protein [Pediococcus acidilactici]KAF0372555.1 family 1 glycosylhydrolase [Pediococcus acidilactici]KAF0391631.1 family 1 glycosylhydrolase [Pediococcus acidilactici]
MLSKALAKDFLWGNSTSSMQTEGASEEGGKGKSVYDVHLENKETSIWDTAIDEYHRYEEDFDLMQEMGMTCYRFQISWSRVCPQGDGDFNEEGIEFYRRLIDALIERGITPMVCLYHFDMPLNLSQKYNGFLSRKVVDAFVRFAKKMVDLFAEKVPYWITFNEQNLYSTSYAPIYAGCDKNENSDEVIYTIAHHVMVAHAKVANYLHQTTNSQVGGMLAYEVTYPATTNPQDQRFARQIDEYMNRNLLEVFMNGQYSSEVMAYTKNHNIDFDFTNEDKNEFKQLTSDFIAFSYYRSNVIDSSRVPINTIPNRYLDYGMVRNTYTRYNEWDWNVDPLAFREVMTKIFNTYKIPVFPIENGIGVREDYHGKEINDSYRIDYHQKHIKALKDAVFEDGVKVLGYLGWGLIDIPSSSGDMEKRYGTVYVNRDNQEIKDLKRIPKKSFYWLKEVITSNGKNLNF